jgi:RimJ/RimL family protein N-acetyltransferase
MTSSGFDRPPLVETERLRLRAHAVDDLPFCTAMWADPLVTRFIGGKPFTREEVWARMTRYAGMWALVGHGFWAVEEKASGQLVGEVGVMEARRDIQPSFEGEPEIGWALVPAAHGKGYAAEAVAAALVWSDKHLHAPMQVCIIDPGNTASLRIAQKFGFRERARSTYHGVDTIQFERPRHARVKSNG